MKNPSQQRGFVALTSAIIISAVLVALMLSAGMASFYARLDALGAENKRQAHALAESCVQVALLALSTSTDPIHYMPINQMVDAGIDAWGDETDCMIRDVIHSGSNATVETYASSGDSFDSVSADVSLAPSIQIISWGESP